MGEGWLLTAEMLELIHSGTSNIVCTQPFGCLPNHIVGKGMIRKLKDDYPDSNIVAIDYDPGATKINQENRIKLMLAECLTGHWPSGEKAARARSPPKRRRSPSPAPPPMLYPLFLEVGKELCVKLRFASGIIFRIRKGRDKAVKKTIRVFFHVQSIHVSQRSGETRCKRTSCEASLRLCGDLQDSEGKIV